MCCYLPESKQVVPPSDHLLILSHILTESALQDVRWIYAGCRIHHTEHGRTLQYDRAHAALLRACGADSTGGARTQWPPPLFRSRRGMAQFSTLHASHEHADPRNAALCRIARKRRRHIASKAKYPRRSRSEERRVGKECRSR